jgi:hypothetical protein
MRAFGWFDLPDESFTDEVRERAMVVKEKTGIYSVCARWVSTSQY